MAGGGRRCAYQSLRNIPFPPPGISSAPLSEVVLMLARCIILMSVTTPEACLTWEGLGVTMSPSGRSRIFSSNLGRGQTLFYVARRLWTMPCTS